MGRQCGGFTFAIMASDRLEQRGDRRPGRAALKARGADSGIPRPDLSRAAQPVIESLESRLLMSVVHYRTVAGHIFNDINGNGTRQLKEHWLPGVVVFLDSNANGTFDSGEPATVTNKLGTFTFRRLLPGAYNVVEVPPLGDVATVPSGGM